MANVLKLLSCNVSGLCDRKRRSAILGKLVYDIDLASHPHILFFQDTRLKKSHRREIELDLGNYEVFQVFRGTGNDESRTCQGMLTAIHRGLDCEILHDIRDRDFIITHCRIMGEEYVFANVYARGFESGEAFSRVLQRLWVQITKYQVAKIILGGDFNAVTDIELESTTSSGKRELRTTLFSDFVEETGLSDPWRAFNPATRRFTYFRRTPPNSSRIDRFLVSDLAFNYTWDADIGTSFMSDHSHITLELLLNRNDRGKGLFRFPDALCSNVKFQELLAKDIETFTLVNVTRPLKRDRASPRVLWDTLKSVIRGRTIKFMARSKRESAKDLKLLQREIEDLTRLRDGFVEYTEEYDEVLDKLQAAEHDFEERFVRHRKCAHVIHSARYQVYGNTSSSYFFREVRGVPGALRFLFNDVDDILESDEEILDHCRVFYDNLYSSPYSTSFKMSNFSYVPPEKRISTADAKILDEEFYEEELHTALKNMRKGSSPGFDGLTVNFYLTFWNLISPFLIPSIQQAASLGSFTLDQRRGVIKMLPKRNKSPTRVANLRPITLLNVDYKLVTKVLSLRLKEIIPKIVHTDQTGFVTNRFLGSNVLDIQTLLHILDRLEQRQEIATLSLDIQKAFDTVDWGFIRLVLRSYGFPDSFLTWVTAMQSNVELRVLNNGHLSDPIIAKKGVAQGCSLSPYLFILMIETLAHHIRMNPRLKGLVFHDYEKKINLVADDCLLTLQATIDNFVELHTTLSHFSAVSGLKTNFHKSVLLCDSYPDGWLQHPAVSIYKHATMADGFTYLGVRLGNPQVLASNFQLNDITMKDMLRSRPLQATSLSGRILAN